MKVINIREGFERELNKPLGPEILSDELFIALTNKAVQEIAGQLKSWWIKFQKTTQPNIRLYKLDYATLGFYLLGIRFLFWNEEYEITPESLEYIFPQTALGDPVKYHLFWDDHTPFIILYPKPVVAETLHFFAQGYTPVTGLHQDIPLPEYAHILVAKKVEEKLFTILNDQRALLRIQEVRDGIKDVNSKHADVIPLIGGKTHIIYQEFD